MAIAFGAIGTKATQTTGATPLAIAYPASPGAGDMAVAARATWNTVGALPSTESGWTRPVSPLFGGNAGGAVDNHRTTVGVDVLQLTGSESGSVNFDTAGTIDGSVGVMLRYTKGAGETWDTVQGATGDDATHGANASATSSTNLDLAPGDWVTVIKAEGTDASLTITSPAITAPGITFGTTTRRTSGAGSSAGQDGNVEVFDAQVTAGSGNVAVTLTFTTATSQSGPAAFIRLRATAAGTQYPASGTVAATGETSGSVALRAAVAGTIAAVAAVAGAASLAKPASGTIAATSSTSGAVTALKPSSGTTAASTTTAGTPTSLLPTSGAVSAASGTSGTVGKLYVAEGAVAATSGTAGDVDALLPASGSIDATSSTSGGPTALLAVTGTTPAVSGTSGSASIIGGPQQYPAAGVVTASSAVLGDVRALLVVAGLIEATSDTAGSIGAVYVVAGTVEAVSGTTGAAEIPTEPSGPGPNIVAAVPAPPRFMAAPARSPHSATAGPPRYTANATIRHTSEGT